MTLTLYFCCLPLRSVLIDTSASGHAETNTSHGTWRKIDGALRPVEELFTLADLVTGHIHRAAQSGQLKVHTVLLHFLAVRTKKEACVSGEWSTGRG